MLHCHTCPHVKGSSFLDLILLYLLKVSHACHKWQKYLLRSFILPILMFTANDSSHATSSEKERKATISISTSKCLEVQKKTKKKRKQWSEESMVAATDAVKGGESVLRAAKQFGVPRQILGDRVSGKVVHGTNLRPKPFLMPVEEKELLNFIVDVAKAGYGKTRKQIMGLAESVA